MNTLRPVIGFWFAIAFAALASAAGMSAEPPEAPEAGPAEVAPDHGKERPLDAQGRRNLEALAWAWGAVRFFHPDARIDAADVPDLLIAAVDVVEPAATSAELVTALRRVFGPVAPAVQIWEAADQVAPQPALNLDMDPSRHVVFWRHLGLGTKPEMRRLGATPIYSSSRLVVPREDIDQFAARRKPWEQELASTGVMIRVPLVLPCGPKGGIELPAQGAVLRPERPNASRQWRTSGRDRSTRLAAVIAGWSAMNCFYPYFDVVPTDWKAALGPSLIAAAEASDARAMVGVLTRLNAQLHDGHGAVMHEALGQPRMLPVPLLWLSDGTVVLGRGTISGTKAGDEVIAINGQAIAEVQRTFTLMSAHATATSVRSQFASPFRLGRAMQWPRETTMRVRSAAMPGEAGEGRDVSVTLSDQAAPMFGYMDPIPDGREVAPGLRYYQLSDMRLPPFNKALPDMAKSPGLVFDLRGYPSDAAYTLLGHLTDKSIQSARWRVPQPTRPHEVKSTDMFDSQRWLITPLLPRLGGELAGGHKQQVFFLTGGGAISYAESIMGIVEYYKLGTIIGEDTAGTNGNINTLNLPGGFRWTFTGMRVEKHDRARHHGIGIRPNVQVSVTQSDVQAGRDPVLQRAIELYQEVQAQNQSKQNLGEPTP